MEDDIYKVTENVGMEDWRKFARKKLRLKNLERIEEKYGTDHTEIKYQSVIQWNTSGKSEVDVCKELKRLKHEFFCGDFVGESVQQVPVMLKASGDEDGSASIVRAGTVTEESKEIYPINGKKGCALIISNSFQDKQDRKPGCYKDVENMEKLWKDTLKCDLFENTSHVDQTKQQMVNLFDKMAALKKDTYAYVVIIIMTHGGKEPCEYNSEQHGVPEYREVVFGNDRKYIAKCDIETKFNNWEAEGLRNVPKFFIYDSCRGNRAMKGIKEERPANVVRENAIAIIPEVSDIISIHSSHPEYKAFSSVDGSWLISAITKVFTNHASELKVIDMLTRVNALMWACHGHELRRGDGYHEVKSMSIFESSLIKDFYLLPPKQLTKQAGNRKESGDATRPKRLGSAESKSFNLDSGRILKPDGLGHESESRLIPNNAKIQAEPSVLLLTRDESGPSKLTESVKDPSPNLVASPEESSH